ncbi:MAG: hypothetical protein COW67_00945, partial [Flavobacteriales bacterium CG18_big_fil_WC_8_21_14_2_50_32_9]
MNKNKILHILLILVLLGDFTYSFLQYYKTPLDGDMASVIIPSNDNQEIFNDPFGFNAIINNKPHINPNRYFSHLFISKYFKSIPIIFQKIVSPIESLYLSCAIIKILIHILMVYLLSALISREKSVFNIKLLMVAALLTPLFQAYGYNRYMGVIDTSITYTFFYALPLLLLLLFFYHFYAAIHNNEKTKHSIVAKISLLLLIIILPFSGPLIPPIILITTILLVIYYLQKNIDSESNYHLLKKVFLAFNKIPNFILVVFIPISVLCVYSLLLGTYYSLSQTDTIPIIERYVRLPMGIYYQFTQKLGFPLLFILISVNFFIIKKYFYTKEGKIIITTLKWIGVFFLIYTLLLPLGGYKAYRANILRFDTIMPITICLFYFYGLSSFFLLKNMKNYRILYFTFIITFSLFFANADISKLNENDCERQALISIANSDKSIVELDNNCKVMSWEVITDYKQSELNATLLYLLE